MCFICEINFLQIHYTSQTGAVWIGHVVLSIALCQLISWFWSGTVSFMRCSPWGSWVMGSQKLTLLFSKLCVSLSISKHKVLKKCVWSQRFVTKSGSLNLSLFQSHLSLPSTKIYKSTTFIFSSKWFQKPSFFFPSFSWLSVNLACPWFPPPSVWVTPLKWVPAPRGCRRSIVNPRAEKPRILPFTLLPVQTPSDPWPGL